MMHLLLADDHALVREGLKQLFALTTDIRVAAEATNGAQVIEAIRSQRFDVILLDLTMPGISGPDLITRLRGQEGAPPILVLSMHNEPQIARRALAAGASGYLTKDSNPEVLLGAVRRVAAGGRFLDPVLAEAMAFEQPLASRDRPPHESLSDRELQVFNLLARGMGVNDIAQQLAISNKTVSTHKARLMEKLSLATTTDIVRYAISYGLME